MKRRPPQLPLALCNPGLYPHAANSVHVVETHISWILLVGRYAYKIKKPVNLGFLDFTQLSTRKFFCEEEIRLNRRLAPSLYLEVVSIGGTPDHPVLCGRPVIEYAVKMRRFASGRLLDQLLTEGQLTSQHIDQLAACLARFHDGLPPALTESNYGTPKSIIEPARDNFQQLAELLKGAEADLLSGLKSATEREYGLCQERFEQRRQEGYVRECHGDLHLGNIVLLRNAPVPFDGIEFDANLRWIDVMSEVAFLVMDLIYRGRQEFACRFLNAYLETRGDYAGLGVLRFYLGYRAIVRAKISAIRASQDGSTGFSECIRHLTLADDLLNASRPALIITHGLPGSGKSSVTQVALEKLQAIRIRSDVERKRLFGLAAHENSHGRIAGGIYGAESTRRTYGRMLTLACELLELGYTVIIDAAFLKHSERQQFQSLAAELRIPFAILSVRTDVTILRQRISQRMQHGRDASEADLVVLEKLAAISEPLDTEERARAVEFVNEGKVEEISSQLFVWNRLDSLLDTVPERK